MFDDLSQPEWERTLVVIDRLASLGLNARMPFSRSLGEGLFEVRFTLGSTARRITYRFTRDGRIVLLTRFRSNATRTGRGHSSSQDRSGLRQAQPVERDNDG